MQGYFKRIIILLLDGVGVGELPDAHEYGDVGANTLGNLSRKLNGLNLPNLESFGLGNIIDIQGVSKVSNPKASYGKMREVSKGKDTTTGHWEIAGLRLKEAFRTFPNGFPEEIIKEFEEKCGYSSLGNIVASGTEIIKNLGEQHVKEKKPIIYTSADSVFQIAAHEEVFPIEKQYEICEIARKICDKYNIGRVIARPFIGKTANDFKRTPNRKDFSVVPFDKTVLNYLDEKDYQVIGVGKIDYIFAFSGINDSIHTVSNKDGVFKTIEKLKILKKGLLFTNLVDFDMLWGHRNDLEGYKKGLEEVDSLIPQIINAMEEEDLLIITADHGCDPTFPGTDHTREHIPLLAYSSKQNKYGVNLGTRQSFSDIAKTIDENFGLNQVNVGKSFLKEII